MAISQSRNQRTRKSTSNSTRQPRSRSTRQPRSRSTSTRRSISRSRRRITNICRRRSRRRRLSTSISTRIRIIPGEVELQEITKVNLFK